MDRVAILLNPSSGRGRSLKRRPKIERAFRDYGIPFDLFISRSEEHLRQLAHECAVKYNRIVAVGGDTTYKIVAKELLALPREPGQKRPVLGMLGTGSANDVVRSLGTFDVKDLCKALAGDKIGRMNVGKIKIDGRQSDLFLGAVCMGLGTTVNLYIDSFNRRHPQMAKSDLIGQVIAGLMAMRCSFREEQVPMTATLSWERESRLVNFSLLAFLNVPFFASGILFVPDQSAFLRLLDIVIVDTLTIPSTLGVALAAVRGKHLARRD